MTLALSPFWTGLVSVVGAFCLSWSLFSLGRLWERDHPAPERIEGDIAEAWDWLSTHDVAEWTDLPTRPGLYDYDEGRHV